ncbi:group II intron reverse transcriptase/maturase [Nocardia sp. CA-135953]|uniref:group II intron reverse transcriptase/maturase n=1 Tax=Nocardia sp. CA-135953 TaxID=3239978 RepID=UPI003D9629E6
MQAKLHRWAAADPGRRFDDLFNLVHDPATLMVAFDRVAGNHGARTPGVDGMTAADVEELIGVPGFLDDLRTSLKDGSFRPLPVRERKIPKPGGSGKVRRLGIPTVTDRVVQAALKLVLEPIFEADFEPVSYGFRPNRRAQDAIAEIHYYSTRGYRWVLDADIEACFDRIDHVALMERVRLRVKDKRVLALVKAFLKAGILTELGDHQDTTTGTPQGGILSPLLANIALSVLDEQVMAPWKPGGTMASESKRAYRRRKGAPTWRLVRYADDFVVLIHGTRDDAEAMREQVEQVLSPLGLRLSPEKTVVRHLSDGVDFLGFHIQWRRKRGSDKRFVYTFVGDRPIRSLKTKVRALTHRGSQQSLDYVIMRLNQILRGWSNYFKHAVAKARFTSLQHFVWQRVIRMLQTRHRWGWKDIRRRFTTASGRWLPISAADGTVLFDMGNVTVSRYRWRGHTIPNRWTTLQPA